MPERGLHAYLLVAAGCTAVALGTAGIFLPLLPTTPFLLLAAACFIRSSDRLYAWLVTNRWLGAYIRNYREHRAVTRTAKVVTLSLLGYSVVRVVSLPALRALLLCIAAAVTLHVLRLKTLTADMLSGREERADQ